MVTCAATLNIDGEFSRRSHTNWIKLTGSYCTFISCQEGPKSVHVPHRIDFNFRISCGFPVRQGLICITSNVSRTDSQSLTALADYGDIMMAACKHVLIGQVCFKSPSIPVTVEEETQESYFTGIKLADKTKTLELEPESKRFSSTLEKKKEKPVFLSELSPAAVTVGETATFTVRVSGFPKPTVQWFHNGHTITSSSVYTFIHEHDEYSLVINTVHRECEGEYSCTVSNRFAEERTFAVTGKRPEFTKTIESLQRQEGAQGVFSYTVTGDPLPEVQWLKGTSHIQPSGFCIIVNNPDGSGFINIKSVKQEHSGIYTCKASNQYGEASCTAELLVFREKAQEEDTTNTNFCVISAPAVYSHVLVAFFSLLQTQ
uniref:Ig-like domain-containing protein n=1 Tax=Maylandia zebra TaxID=106582 RepID=A0A3P9BF27_9CICH